MQELTFYSKHFKGASKEETEKIVEILEKWVFTLFLETRSFSLSDTEGIPLDSLIEEETISMFTQKLERQIGKLERMNIWLQNHREKEGNFFTFLEYVYKMKAKEEIAQNLLHQNIDKEWITMITGLSEEELNEI